MEGRIERVLYILLLHQPADCQGVHRLARRQVPNAMAMRGFTARRRVVLPSASGRRHPREDLRVHESSKTQESETQGGRRVGSCCEQSDRCSGPSPFLPLSQQQRLRVGGADQNSVCWGKRKVNKRDSPGQVNISILSTLRLCISGHGASRLHGRSAEKGTWVAVFRLLERARVLG